MNAITCIVLFVFWKLQFYSADLFAPILLVQLQTYLRRSLPQQKRYEFTSEFAGTLVSTTCALIVASRGSVHLCTYLINSTLRNDPKALYSNEFSTPDAQAISQDISLTIQVLF